MIISLLFIYALIHSEVNGQDGSLSVPKTELQETSVTFRLANPDQFLFLPGDNVPMIVSVTNNDSIPKDSIRITFASPNGTRLNDPFWKSQELNSERIINQLNPGERIDLSLTVAIDRKFTGTTLSFTIKLAGTEVTKSVNAEVAKLISTINDTCAYVRDSTSAGINTFISTRKLVVAGLRRPVDLSPTGPVRVSPKNCTVFKLKPPKKKQSKKEKCSCLVYDFVGETGRNYPKLFTPDSKQLRRCEQTISGSRAGDTISISVKTLDLAPLRGIMLTDKHGELIDAIYDSPTFEFEQVLTEDTAQFRLHLRANRRFCIFPVKQYAFINVTRKPRTIDLIRDEGKAPIAGNATIRSISKGQIGTSGVNRIQSETLVKSTAEESVFFVVHETLDSTGFVIKRDTISSDTCQGSYQVEQLESKRSFTVLQPIDTLLSSALEEEFTVVGRRNPFGIRQGAIEIKVPTQLNVADPPAEDSLIAIAYWVGIGEGPINAYTNLTEEVPKEWTQPGISAPLAAFGAGYPVLLPGLMAGELIFQEEVVRYDFVGQRGKVIFAAGKTSYPVLIDRQEKRPNYGVISGPALDRLRATINVDDELGKPVLTWYFVYKGLNEINSYRIQLKLVAYYRLSEPREVWQTITPLQP